MCSNYYNDIVYDELNELDGDLTEAQRADIQTLLDEHDLESALYMSRYYSKQNGKAYIRAIMDANGQNRQSRPGVQSLDKDS